MAKSAIPSISDLIIKLSSNGYNAAIDLFDKSREDLRYHSFDKNVILGSESMDTLPVMQGYDTLFADIWHLMINLDLLVDKDVKDIREKAQHFVDVDNQLGH